MENLNLLKSLSKISEQLESPRSEHEMFNATNWEDLKVSMNAHFELFTVTGDTERLQWFLSRITNAVKVIWAKFADNNPISIFKFCFAFPAFSTTFPF